MEFEFQQYHHCLWITEKIATLGWKRFVKSPKSSVESIIQKFYANVPDVVNSIAMV